jgi:hypothetical protein
MPVPKNDLVEIIKGISKFQILEEILKRKDWVKYKTIPGWHGKVIGNDIVLGDPGKEFVQVTEKHVNAYIFNKEAPPAEIAAAIMNIADDYLSGREMVMRAGDYITIQNYVRKSGK